MIESGIIIDYKWHNTWTHPLVNSQMRWCSRPRTGPATRSRPWCSSTPESSSTSRPRTWPSTGCPSHSRSARRRSSLELTAQPPSLSSGQTWSSSPGSCTVTSTPRARSSATASSTPGTSSKTAPACSASSGMCMPRSTPGPHCQRRWWHSSSRCSKWVKQALPIWVSKHSPNWSESDPALTPKSSSPKPWTSRGNQQRSSQSRSGKTWRRSRTRSVRSVRRSKKNCKYLSK